MYVIGISGSPRKGGNTDILLEEALKGARDSGAKTEKIILNDLNIRPCQECLLMPEDGTCKVKDDFQPLFKKIMEADRVILAAPIFFGSLSAQTKIMVDRFQCYWRARYILKTIKDTKKKPGAFILVEASEREDFLNSGKVITKNLFATIGLEYKSELTCKGVDKKGAVLEKKDVLEKAFKLGKEIAQR